MVSLARGLLLIFGLLSVVLAAGTVGFHVVEGWAWFDSFYMALITLTTVGFGEVFPMSTEGRVFASLFMLSGVTAMFVSIALLGDLVIKLELADYFGRRRRQRMFGKLSDHFIVCGAGRVGRCVVEGLLRSGVEVSVIENDPGQAKWAIDRDLPVIVADATRDDTLRAARIESAAGLVAAVASDAENVYVTLTARVLNPKLRISARASDEQAEDKLRTAGATTVLTPYPFIGHRLAQSEIHENYGVIVLAIQKPDEAMLFNPAPGTRIEVDDYLIAMGDVSDLKRMETDFE